MPPISDPAMLRRPKINAPAGTVHRVFGHAQLDERAVELRRPR